MPTKQTPKPGQNVIVKTIVGGEKQVRRCQIKRVGNKLFEVSALTLLGIQFFISDGIHDKKGEPARYKCYFSEIEFEKDK